MRHAMRALVALGMAACVFSGAASAQTSDPDGIEERVDYEDIFDDVVFDFDADELGDPAVSAVFSDDGDIRALSNGQITFGTKRLDTLLAGRPVWDRALGFRWIAAHEVVHQFQNNGAYTLSSAENEIDALNAVKGPLQSQLRECQADVIASAYVMKLKVEEMVSLGPEAVESSFDYTLSLLQSIVPVEVGLVDGVATHPSVQDRQSAVSIGAHAALLYHVHDIWTGVEAQRRQEQLDASTLNDTYGNGTGDQWALSVCEQLLHISPASENVSFAILSEVRGEDLNSGHTTRLRVRNHNTSAVRVDFQVGESDDEGWGVSGAINYLVEIPAKSSIVIEAEVKGSYDYFGGFLPYHPFSAGGLYDAKFITIADGVRPKSEADTQERLAALMAMDADDRTFARSLIRVMNSASTNFDAVRDLNNCQSFTGNRTCATLIDFPGFEAQVWEHENGAYETQIEFSTWAFLEAQSQATFGKEYNELSEDQKKYITSLEREFVLQRFEKLKAVLRGYVKPGLEYHDFAEPEYNQIVAYANVAPGALAKLVFDEEILTLTLYIFGF